MFDLLIKGGILVDGTGQSPGVADVGIKDGVITAVGVLDGNAAKVIDAAGLYVTPGWIDPHTHYDGQATWDPWLDPSFSSGVTTCIFGNCGVGFAPVHSGEEEALIELMEGVEEIPGTALHAGMKWRWNSFPEYLDALDAMPRSFDVATLMPHGPLRQFVMGSKVGTDRCADAEDLSTLVNLVDEGLEAGAFGVSSSRTRMHRTSRGAMTPDFDVDKPELAAIARVVSDRNGIMEFAPAGVTGEDFEGLAQELELYQQLVEETGVALHFLLLQTAYDTSGIWQRQLDWAADITASGRGEVYGLVGARPLGNLLGFSGTHPFMDRPTFKRVMTMPKDERYAELGKSEIRAAILSEANEPNTPGDFLTRFWPNCYDISAGISFEPTDAMRLETIAREQGIPIEEFAYDLMLLSEDAPRIMMILANYADGSLDGLGRMLRSPGALLSLSDAGAHSMTICDGTIHTYVLTDWVRDRRPDSRFRIEEAVRLMTSRPAAAFRLHDRGIVAPGYKADINIIDLNRLSSTDPHYVDDLPAGATRLLQKVTGYRATIVSGIVTRENDEPTGALPGRLVRFGRSLAA